MKGRIATLGELLLETLRGAGQTVYADRAGLYLVELVDDHALAFAVALHTRVRSGPDPAELRRRALAAGLRTVRGLADLLAALEDAGTVPTSWGRPVAGLA